MELLIIGAGAVGSTYGYLASRQVPGAGAKVTYLIKLKHRSDLIGGIQLYWWKGRKAASIHFTDYSLIDEVKELRSKKFDAVLITLPSDKLRADGWFEGFFKDFNIGSPEGKIWSLQGGLTDQNFLREKMGAANADARLVKGSIPIMGYLAPLPGEPFEKPGYAFYTPPTSKAPWASKNASAAEAAAKLFDSGGLPSKVVPLTPKSTELLPESLLRSVVAGLERSEWSFDRLLNGENIYLVTGGMREMMTIGAKSQKTEDPGAKWWGKFGSTPFAVRTAIRLVKKIVPFDFEAFMRVHFTKVDGQMHLTLDEQIEYGKKNGISTTNLVLLRGRKKDASH
jgi:hypothetical protein